MFLAIALVMIVLSAVLMRRRRVVGVGVEGVRGRSLLVLGLGGWRRGWLLRAKLGIFTSDFFFFFCVVVLVCGFLGCS